MPVGTGTFKVVDAVTDAAAAQKTAYLGPEASFSHQAVVEALPTTNPVPLPSFRAILQAVQENEYDLAILPVENSTNGSVMQALDLLALCGLDPDTSQYEDVEVIDEHYLEVHHCLFVPRAWAERTLSKAELASLPFAGYDAHQQLSNQAGIIQDGGIDLGSVLKKLSIKTLYTHPQVWGQCNNILSALLPPGYVERVDMNSTSAAAAYVATHPETEGGATAAISSSLAGRKHQTELICVAQNIEDEPGANTTRFLILRNKKTSTSQSTETEDMAQMKSLWTFTITHYQPGALATALSVFAKHHFNLSAIQSRPKPKARRQDPAKGNTMKTQARDADWKYVFFVECLHTVQALKQEGGMQKLLEDLQGATEQVSLLGSWMDRSS